MKKIIIAISALLLSTNIAFALDNNFLKIIRALPLTMLKMLLHQQMLLTSFIMLEQH
jgi:hypothetical protein